MIIHAHYLQKSNGDPTFEWLQARAGIVTASEMDSLVTGLGKVKTGDGPHSMLCRKVAERWSGGPLPSFTSFAMEQGSILEERALPTAEVLYDLSIKQVGFVTTDDGRVGCSPDGLIGFEGLDPTKPTKYTLTGKESGIEAKCPQLETHIKYLLAGEVPKEYMPQIQACMAVTGCATWHFMSYRRGLPPLHLIVERDEKFQEAIAEAVAQFNIYLDDAMESLEKINGGPPERKPVIKQPTPAAKSEYTSGDDVTP